MALTAGTTIEINSGGNDLNGGGFNPARGGGGADMTYPTPTVVSFSDLACNNNTTLTSASATFTSTMVGNLIQIASGTNFTAGFYEITAFTNTSTVTLDRNPELPQPLALARSAAHS